MPKSSSFYPSNTPVNHVICAQAAPDLIALTSSLPSQPNLRPGGTSTGSATRVDRVASVYGDSITIAALGNINTLGAQVKSTGNLVLDADGSITAQSLAQTYSVSTPNRTSYYNTATTSNLASNFTAGKTLVLDAGQTVTLTGSNASAGNNLRIAAQQIDIKAATDSQAVDSNLTSKNGFNQNAASSQSASGANLTAGGNATLISRGAITLSAANIDAKAGQTSLIAAGPISIAGITTVQTQNSSSASRSSGFLSSKSTSAASSSTSTLYEGSSIGGNTVLVQSGQDITVKGSTVVADKAVQINASGNVSIEAATNKTSESSFSQTKESGFLSGGGFGITYGSRDQSLDQKGQSTTAQASTIGSLKGNLNITAGNAFSQVGSNLIAPAGDISITAKKADILEARETSNSATEQKFKQTGLTLSISSPVISAIQSAQGMAQAAGNTSDSRMKALAVASTGLNIYNNAGNISEAITNPAASNPAAAARITLSLGTSKSQSNQASQSNTAKASTLAAGGNVNVTATGAGKQSSILIQGSEVKADNAVNLAADNQINLQAAKNESSQLSTNTNSSGSISISYGAGGWGFGASASKGQGKSDGQDLSYTNTQITAGNIASIKSAGDTNIKGAVIAANTIKADVGTTGQGSLNIESLQDKSSYTSEQKSVSGSISVGGGAGTGGSISASKSNINSTFKSVTQQSGLKAGDGGFQVSVANNTDLKGGAIASTQKAVDDKTNTFSTGGQLTTSDVQNTASFKGSGFSVSASISTGKDKAGNQVTTPGGSMGIGSDKGNAASTTAAGITGVAGNKDARTSDKETGLQKIFDESKVNKKVNASIAITGSFGQQASKAIGNYAAGQMDEAGRLRVKAQGLKADDPERSKLTVEADTIEAKWGDKGYLRTAAHTVVGGLTGGLNGAAGAATGTLTSPLIASALADAGITGPLATIITGIGSTALSGLVGGTNGAAGGFNEVVNNYLTPRENLARNKAASACASSGFSDSKSCGEANRLNILDKRRDAEIAAGVAACDSTKNPEICNSSNTMVSQLREKGMNELKQLAIELAPTCAPPKDCAQAANWGRTELSTLDGAKQQLWPFVASGAVQPTAGPVELIAGGWVTVGTRVLASQTALAPEAAVNATQWGLGVLKSGATGTVLYVGMNIYDLENITPANLAIAAAGGAVGSGLVRRGLNYGATLPNTFIPLTVPNVVTQATGQAFGFGTIGWLNTTPFPNSGNSLFTLPLFPTQNQTPPSVGVKR